MKPRLKLWDGLYAVCRLSADAKPPAWAFQDEFYSITKTPDEVSVVCPQSLVPPDVLCERGWRLIGMRGPLDFSLTGVLSAVSAVLAQNRISLFTVSTYDTDYLLVKQKDIEKAVNALKNAGYDIN